MRPIVWIPNNSAHDFSTAEQWGSLRFLSQGWINRFAVAEMHRCFEQQLKKSNKEDYLLVTSLTIMNVVAASILATKHNRLNLLLYRDGRYVERRIVLKRENFLLEQRLANG